MRIAVLCSADSWYLDDLQRAAGDRHTITPVSFRQLAAEVGSIGGKPGGSIRPLVPQAGSWSGTPVLPADRPQLSCGGVRLTDFDALLVRTMPPASLEQVVFRMDLLGGCEAAGITVINPARAIEAAVDKYLTTARMAAAGLPVPRTWVCQTVEDAMTGFHSLGRDVVLKPLFGGEGRGITRLNDDALAQRAFSLLVPLGAVIYLQEFVAHQGYDLRVLLMGDRHWVIRRANALDWRTNLSRGAVAEPVQPTREMLDLARRAAAAVDAPVAGVDLLPDGSGTLYAIEVNAVPGWRATATALGVDIAGCLLDYVAESVNGRGVGSAQPPVAPRQSVESRR